MTKHRSHDGSNQRIDIGEIKAAYGIKGWVKIFSYTRPIEQIFTYKGWLIGEQATECQLEDCDKRSNNGLIAKIKGIDDRTAALSLTDKTIAVYQSEFEVLDEGYYWSQLIGLNVSNRKGEHLGQVRQMIETGANDVMVVKAEDIERLIPYADSIVLKVELETGQIIVDWETDY